jgi:sirohydrochlorin cobaltochelatase
MEVAKVTIAIVLAMHGAPPRDFPKDELAEFFSLHTQLEHVPQHVRDKIKPRYDELDSKMRAWPRNEKNDPFYFGAQKMAQQLGEVTGFDVVIGYNEFCAPELVEAITMVQEKSPEKIIVITPMMTRGGEHSEIEIPKAIERAQKLDPGIPIVYAWPFEVSELAQFLSSQIKRFI